MKLLDLTHGKGNWESNGDNARAECLWCGHNALEISTSSPHQFQCWHCKQTGNAWTLLQGYYENKPNLKIPDVEQLAQSRPGIKTKVLQSLGLRKDGDLILWPVYNVDGKLAAIYRWNGEMMISSPSPCSLTLLGLPDLKANGPVWICEGHWDYAAFLSHAPVDGISVIGLCGSSWPSKKLSILENREVVFLGDNDEAGRTGVTSLAKRMKRQGTLPYSLSYLDWKQVTLPDYDTIPDKFDVRDLCKELYS